MKKQLGIILIFAFSAACTFNVGTGNNAANAPVSNTATADNKTNKDQTATAPAKKADPGEASKSNSTSDDPNAEDEQIQFAKGETDTTLERTIAPGVNKMYSFNAKKGQIVWFKVTEDTNQLDVDFNKNPVTLGEEVREPLNASGDWAIYVSNPTDKPLKYKLWIGIE